MSIYDILPALDLTQSIYAKISIGMHRGFKFKISRIPLIGLVTRLGWRYRQTFLRNPNLYEIKQKLVYQYNVSDKKWKKNWEYMYIYEILPALDMTQSVHAKMSIGMHRGVKYKISRIPLIGLDTRLGWRYRQTFLRNPNLNEIKDRGTGLANSGKRPVLLMNSSKNVNLFWCISLMGFICRCISA